jgi:hypothetical protein
MQCITYLKATGKQDCPPLDLGKPRPVIKREAHDL